MATLRSAIHSAASRLASGSVPNPQLDARCLAAHAAGLTVEMTLTNVAKPLNEEARRRLESFVARRLSGEPVSRIIGYREFWGMEFHLSPDTLDPRPDSEILVEAALAHVQAKGLQAEPIRILDLGTGSGCLLSALLTELPKASGVAVDRSEPALRTARRNFASLGLSGRAACLLGNWADALKSRSFNIVVANPPYIAREEIPVLSREVRCFDPQMALDGGEDGLNAYREMAAGAIGCLAQDGFAVFEAGIGRHDDVAEAIRSADAENTSHSYIFYRDLSGITRAVGFESLEP